jgi:hypothetical protein
MDKYEKKYVIVKTFKRKWPKKWCGHFLFLNHALIWFLMVPLKDGFVHFPFLQHFLGNNGLEGLS